MQVTFSLSLPHDALTVPVTRHLARSAMHEIGIAPECADAIELALGEACANVLQHSEADDHYDVTMSLDQRLCVIRVLDRGRGFDAGSLSDGPPDTAAERGRGIELMKTLVDNIKLTSRPEAGTIVHLEKELRYLGASIMLRLADRTEADSPQPGDGLAKEPVEGQHGEPAGN